jgi:PAS domain S-box-containing protein
VHRRAVRDQLSPLEDSNTVRSTDPLEPHEELYRPMLEAIPHVVWMASADGSTTYLNRRSATIIGVDAAQVAGWNWLELLHPDDVDRSRACWESAVHSGTEYVNEYRLRQSDGTYRWYLAKAVPLHMSDGRAAGWMGTWTDIDDRRRAEERHRHAAHLLANVRECIIVTDAHGIVTYWNDAATVTYGWTAEEICGQPLLGRFPHEAHPFVADVMRQIADGHEWRGEFEDYHKDGSRIWVDARVAGIHDAAGELIGTMGTSHDITSRKRAEAQRDQITARLRLQIDRMPLAYLLFDPDLQLIDWNTAAEQIFGYAREEVIGMMPPFCPIVPRPAWAASGEILARLRSGDMAAHQVNENITKDGRTITCEWSNTPLLDRDGTFIGLISLAQDITQRRRADDALRSSEERFRQIAESISEVFWLTTPDKHEIVYLSPGYETIWGQTREASYAAPQSWLEAIHADDRERVAQAAVTNQRAGTYDEEYRIVRPDGTVRWVRDRAFPVLDGSGRLVRIAGVAEDVTARKESEDRLRVTTEQLRGLSASLVRAREEEGRRIARELHDELGGSLSAIKWDLERLASSLNEASEPDLAAVKQRLSGVAGTVAATAAAVRRIASELRPSMLDDLGLVDAIEWHAQEFERRTGIACQVDRAGTAVPSGSIATEVFRIFQEALTNILRHAQASVVDVRIVSGDDAFEMAVRDDGIGMVSADTAQPGLGIVGMRERAALIGATLDVVSARDQGTVIRVRVPLSGDPTTVRP